MRPIPGRIFFLTQRVRPGTDLRESSFLSMRDRDYIVSLIEVVEDLKHRVLKQCGVVEQRVSSDQLVETTNSLRKRLCCAIS